MQLEARDVVHAAKNQSIIADDASADFAQPEPQPLGRNGLSIPPCRHLQQKLLEHRRVEIVGGGQRVDLIKDSTGRIKCVEVELVIDP